jgi:hypothetical protein
MLTREFTSDTPKEYELFCQHYQSEVSRGVLCPEVVWRLTLRELNKNRKLIALQEDKHIRGVAVYTTILFPDRESLEAKIRPYGKPLPRSGQDYFKSVKGFRTCEFPTTFHELIYLESFQKGCGKSMLEHLKAKVGDGVFATVMGGARGWYEKRGFHDTGMIRAVTQLPVYIWMRSGEY